VDFVHGWKIFAINVEKRETVPTHG
jgi:hypothetical protein